MRLTLPKFREILENHGFMAMTDEPYASCLKALKSAEGEGTRDFIAAYCDAYKKRYNFSPRIAGRAAGTAKRIVSELGLETAIEYAWAYLSSNEGFFVTKRHDLATMENNLLAIQQLIETGRTVTRAQLHQNDRAQANAEAMREHLESQGRLDDRPE